MQSYGSRYVRPPVIHADVSRPAAMTVREFQVAQRLTEQPVKGMLTGPVTMLNWAFARNDVSRSTTAYQLALAIRAEVADLEAAGCKIIQARAPRSPCPTSTAPPTVVARHSRCPPSNPCPRATAATPTQARQPSVTSLTSVTSVTSVSSHRAADRLPCCVAEPDAGTACRWTSRRCARGCR